LAKESSFVLYDDPTMILNGRAVCERDLSRFADEGLLVSVELTDDA
jgi:hypothetical protein